MKGGVVSLEPMHARREVDYVQARVSTVLMTMRDETNERFPRLMPRWLPASVVASVERASRLLRRRRGGRCDRTGCQLCGGMACFNCS